MQLFRVTYDRWFKDKQQNWDYDIVINYEYATTIQKVVDRYLDRKVTDRRRYSNVRVVPIDKTNPHYITWKQEFGSDVD